MLGAMEFTSNSTTGPLLVAKTSLLNIACSEIATSPAYIYIYITYMKIEFVRV